MAAPSGAWPLVAIWLLGCQAEIDSSSEFQSQAEKQTDSQLEARSRAEDAPLVELASPTGAGAMAPYLLATEQGPLLSWLEPREGGGHRFQVARLEGDEWSPAVTIAEGDEFFANWADVPKLGAAGDGTLWAHWLEKIGDDTYAYGIFLARSDDGGRSWQQMGMLHDDDSPTEHGFVAYAPAGDSLRALWLDGRAMVDGGAMAVRTALLTDVVGPSRVVDERVCECCPAELVAGAEGDLAFFRDRSATEVRDIVVARERGGEWSAPRPVGDDRWMIPGCPVNGPAAVAGGWEAAVAWFTASDNRPRVQIAFSSDGGATFTPPRLVTDDRPLGRVDLEAGVDGDVWLSWLTAVDDFAELRLARFDSAGERERRVVARTGSSRASGIPRLGRHEGALLLAWVATEDDRPTTVRLVSLDLD